MPVRAASVTPGGKCSYSRCQVTVETAAINTIAPSANPQIRRTRAGSRGRGPFPSSTGQTMTGQLAWLAWLGVHLTLLNGVEQKISTFVDWGWTLLTKQHGKRMILSDGDVPSGPSQS